MSAETWEEWLDFGTWEQGIAARLTVCGPKGCIRRCNEEYKRDNVFLHCSGSNAFAIENIEKVSKVLRLMESHPELEKNLTPTDFITWALTKRTISLPQEMRDWYADRTVAAKPLDGWISGADIMLEYGKLAVGIGQACHEEKLHAFSETLSPVYDYGRIIKYYQDNTEAREKALEDYKIEFKDVSVQGQGNEYTQEYFDSIQEDIDRIRDLAWPPELPYGEVFWFRFDDYKVFKLDYGLYKKELSPNPTDGELFNNYKEFMRSMLFKRDEVVTWLNTDVSTDLSGSVNPVLRHSEIKQNEEENPVQSVGKFLGMLAIYTQYAAIEVNKGFQAGVLSAVASIQDAHTTTDDTQSISASAGTAVTQSVSLGCDVEANIKAWEAALPSLRGAENTAAKLAIEKWRGKSHDEAYRTAIPDGCANKPKEFVSRKKAAAEAVALRYDLSMPDWRSNK